MKQSLIGALVGAFAALACVAFIGYPGEAAAQRTGSQESGTELISLATPVSNDRQQITLIDPKLRSMSVYHVELSTGTVSLKSVRNIYFDLQMVEFNGVSPLPREIRSLLETR